VVLVQSLQPLHPRARSSFQRAIPSDQGDCASYPGAGKGANAPLRSLTAAVNTPYSESDALFWGSSGDLRYDFEKTGLQPQTADLHERGVGEPTRTSAIPNRPCPLGRKPGAQAQPR
jgi:hypothetical protein